MGAVDNLALGLGLLMLGSFALTIGVALAVIMCIGAVLLLLGVMEWMGEKS